MPADHLKVMETHDEMVKEITDTMREGDLILLKGSRKMGLEKVVEGLRGRAQRAEGRAQRAKA